MKDNYDKFFTIIFAVEFAVGCYDISVLLVTGIIEGPARYELLY